MNFGNFSANLGLSVMNCYQLNALCKKDRDFSHKTYVTYKTTYIERWSAISEIRGTADRMAKPVDPSCQRPRFLLATVIIPPAADGRASDEQE